MVTRTLDRPPSLSSPLTSRSATPTDVRAVRRSARRRTRKVLAALAVAVVALFWVDVLLGSYTVTIPDLVRILSGETIPGAGFIVLENKLPRAVVALLVGLAFGVSGAVFQTMLRNPLASPDVIGISSGASTAAVFAIVVLGASGVLVSASAVGGALVVALTIHLLSRRGAAAGQQLILMGIGLSAMLQAGTSYLLSRSDIRTAADAFVWLNGSLNAVTWDRVVQLALGLLVLLPLVLVAARGLRGLEVGDEVATGLGVRVDRVRLLLVLVGVTLAALATAAAGPVAFVAFLAGPVARRLLRGATSLAASGLVGAVIVLAAELVATNVVPGTPLPVGVVTGALGAPFLLHLLVSANRVGRGG